MAHSNRVSNRRHTRQALKSALSLPRDKGRAIANDRAWSNVKFGASVSNLSVSPLAPVLITKISDATTQHCCWLMGSGVRIKTKHILVRVVMLASEERNGPLRFLPTRGAAVTGFPAFGKVRYLGYCTSPCLTKKVRNTETTISPAGRSDCANKIPAVSLCCLIRLYVPSTSNVRPAIVALEPSLATTPATPAGLHSGSWVLRPSSRSYPARSQVPEQAEVGTYP